VIFLPLFIVACGDSPDADERLLGIALTLPGEPPAGSQLASFAGVVEQAHELGSQVVEINIDWGSIQTGAGTFRDPQGQLAEANALQGGNRSVFLNITPYQTTYDARPAYLKALDWDDPSVALEYRNVIEFVLDEMPAIEGKVAHIMIGNEVEFASDEQWQAYADFLVAASEQVKSLYTTRHGGQTVTTSVKLALGVSESASAPWAAALWSLVDWVNVTYYPLHGTFQMKDPMEVATDLKRFLSWLDQQANLGANKLVLISELGYATSDTIAAATTTDGRQNQARFVQEVFRFWDAYADRIPSITFVWLADLSDTQVQGMLDNYGLTSPPLDQTTVDHLFAYFRTLGLFDSYGEPKPGAIQLSAESCARGWTACP